MLDDTEEQRATCDAIAAGLRRLAQNAEARLGERQPLSEVLATISGLSFHPLFANDDDQPPPELPARAVGGISGAW